ncbi:MFS transporter [Chamaesiphon polymorphus CCALA 037]|uniref:MFS transporter n=2 Tax=Chamaesiphon TaxID=217161 RepID=A0A2T1GG38_9CYAN|nr:MFS transporter [Chamaesiphon polymorphus CCALA 037]
MNSTYHRVLWRQVWGLAALLAAILFSWIAYGFYQPVILTKLGFGEIAQSLGIVQGFLGAAIEPLAGAMSDRLMRRVGSRLPAIAVGITLAGLLFVAIGLLLHGNIPLELRWIVPVLMTFWVISMIIFRGPAIALLRQFAPTAALPAANSILTLVFGLVGAVSPIFSRVIELLGSGNTFLLGAVMLTVGAILLWSADPELNLSIFTDIENSTRLSTPKFNRCFYIFGIGLGTGTLVNILLKICPQRVHESWLGFASEYITAGILFVCAIAAIPLERRVKQWGLNRSMVISSTSIVAVILMGLSFNFPAISILTILFGGIAMSILFVAQIPWCLGRLSDRQAGLSTGLYLGGMATATAFLEIIIQFKLGSR